ncbi:CvpA family protein [Lentilactobacillus sp. Marseille-Q4993]|uniref:CvpA family protein n=1 Tax=Lentilactobacillus sp. Marseille-Q4993 TaxID=3039492 RepID=UPI0024BD01FF|nr:CvpA family protein [Lentilactobacillus sp. Marseille-Q4993]
MILDLIIVVIFVAAIISGYRRGFVVEVLNFIGFIAALVIANMYTSQVTSWVLSTFNLESQRVVHWLVFLILYVLVWRIVLLLKRVLRPITRIIGLKQLNALAGAAIKFVISYVLVLIGLHIVLLFPSSGLHDQYQNSTVAHYMISETPKIVNNPNHSEI